MAKVMLNPLINAVYGRLDNLVFRRTATGDTSVIKLADMSNVQWSEAQQVQRQKFKKAAAYGKAVLSDPKVRRLYEKAARKENKRPYDLAISDYFRGRNLLEK